MLTDISEELMMSVIGPMKKFDPLLNPFQSVPIETESEKIGTQLIGIGIGVTRYLDAFPYLDDQILSRYNLHNLMTINLNPNPKIIITIMHMEWT